MVAVEGYNANGSYVNRSVPTRRSAYRPVSGAAARAGVFEGGEGDWHAVGLCEMGLVRWVSMTRRRLRGWWSSLRCWGDGRATDSW
jgi:hypothetical protein